MKLLITALLTGIFFTACGQVAAQKDSQQIKTIQISYPSSHHAWQQAMEAHLNQIKSASLDQVGYEVYDIAAVWAAAGFIEQANRLLSVFWNYKTKDPDDFHNANDGFRVLWALSGKRPDHIPFELKEVDSIVQDN